jgi:hypothetical protein
MESSPAAAAIRDIVPILRPLFLVSYLSSRRPPRGLGDRLNRKYSLVDREEKRVVTIEPWTPLRSNNFHALSGLEYCFHVANGSPPPVPEHSKNFESYSYYRTW